MINIDYSILVVVLTALVALVGIFVIFFGVVSVQRSRDVVSRRMLEFVAEADKSRSQRFLRRIIPREINGSFFSRTVKPLFDKIVDFFGRFTPVNSVNKLNHELAIAGNPFGMHAQEFYGVRVISLLIGIALAILINYRSKPVEFLNLLMGALIIILFLYIPVLWLNSQVRKTKDEIRRNLPDALDMLSVCASAGLGFDQSLQKICDYWPTALGLEFKRVIQEMEMGVTRSQALRNLADRVDVDDLSSFIAIIIQAESMGMSFADVLHSQAEQMRVLRQYRAKEIANTMPAKMIVPLALFIFPALIAVILGPVIPTIMDLF